MARPTIAALQAQITSLETLLRAAEAENQRLRAQQTQLASRRLESSMQDLAREYCSIHGVKSVSRADLAAWAQHRQAH